MVRIIDAYRKGIISYQDYNNLLDRGYTPNSIYSAPSVPSPSPTNSWTELLDWDCEGLSYKLISIENLDTSYELEYKIECYNDSILINYLNDFIELAELKGINPNYLGMIDQVVCTRGEKFVGTWFSTFTGYITRMRGYMGYPSNTVYFGDKEHR